MNQNEIQLPFKRYQIQPVWRADKPQKGRYQEFYQCDVDVVGSESLLYEAELVSIYHEIFKTLGIGVKILINNRKILYGIAEAAGIADKFSDMTVAIDKLDKIGLNGVTAELQARGLNEKQIQTVVELINIPSFEALSYHQAFSASESGKLGLHEVNRVFDFLKNTAVDDLVFDITLARGIELLYRLYL